MFRVKLKAACLHGLLTLVIAIFTASIVFGIWYPREMAGMLGGTNLFLLVLGVELAMGPLISLVIYNPLKLRSELVRDYAIVGVIQLAALLYGLSVVAASRPVYLVFVKDRIEIVAATELAFDDIIAGPDSYQSLSFIGPKLLCTESPQDPIEKSDLLMSALAGKDIQLMPKYYRDCEDGEISGKAYPKKKLQELSTMRSLRLPENLQDKNFSWLPAVTRFGTWVVIFQNGDINKRSYIDFDPF